MNEQLYTVKYLTYESQFQHTFSLLR